MDIRELAKKMSTYECHYEAAEVVDQETLQKVGNRANLFSYHQSKYSIFEYTVLFRTVIDIHFFSIRSLTFYFSIPIISIRL